MTLQEKIPGERKTHFLGTFRLISQTPHLAGNHTLPNTLFHDLISSLPPGTLINIYIYIFPFETWRNWIQGRWVLRWAQGHLSPSHLEPHAHPPDSPSPGRTLPSLSRGYYGLSLPHLLPLKTWEEQHPQAPARGPEWREDASWGFPLLRWCSRSPQQKPGFWASGRARKTPALGASPEQHKRVRDGVPRGPGTGTGLPPLPQARIYPAGSSSAEVPARGRFGGGVLGRMKRADLGPDTLICDLQVMANPMANPSSSAQCYTGKKKKNRGDALFMN